MFFAQRWRLTFASWRDSFSCARVGSSADKPANPNRVSGTRLIDARLLAVKHLLDGTGHRVPMRDRVFIGAARLGVCVRTAANDRQEHCTFMILFKFRGRKTRPIASQLVEVWAKRGAMTRVLKNGTEQLITQITNDEYPDTAIGWAIGRDTEPRPHSVLEYTAVRGDRHLASSDRERSRLLIRDRFFNTCQTLYVHRLRVCR